MFYYIFTFTIRTFFWVGIIKKVNLWPYYNKKLAFHPQVQFTVSSSVEILSAKKKPQKKWKFWSPPEVCLKPTEVQDIITGLRNRLPNLQIL